MTDYPTLMAKAFVAAFGARHDLIPREDEYLIWVEYMKPVLEAIHPGLLDGSARIVPSRDVADPGAQ